MNAHTGNTPGLVEALEVEVRIMANEGHAPVWVRHPDEAGHWVLESVQSVFHDTINGVVQIDHEYAEPHSFDQFMTVFAPPTPRNRDVLEGDLRDFANKIQSEVVNRFGPLNSMPTVKVDLNRSFQSAAAAIVPTLVGVDPHHSGNGGYGVGTRAHPGDHDGRGVPVIMVSDGNGHAGNSNGSNGGAGGVRSGATMWMGAALGALLISTLFLLVSNQRAHKNYNAVNTKYEQLVGEVDERVDAKMNGYRTRYLKRYQQFYSYESEAKRVLADQANQITNLSKAAQKPRPKPLNLPSPPQPDPFIDQELLPAGTDIYELYVKSQPDLSTTVQPANEPPR